MDICRFCDKFNTEANPHCAESREAYDEVLLQTHAFVVVTSLGCLAEGHLLIVTRTHSTSMGALGDAQFAEFVEVKERVRCLLTREYSAPIFFEHGAAPRRVRAGSCIDHAHCHALPVPPGMNLVSDIRKQFHGHYIESISAIRDKGRAQQPYLFFEERNTDKYLFDGQIVPSQYFRQLIAVKLGIAEEWNWQTHHQLDSAHKTIARLRSACDRETT